MEAIIICQLKGHPPGMRGFITNNADCPVPTMALSKSQTARALQVSERTVERLAAQGVLKASRGLRTPRFTIAAIEDYLKRTTMNREGN